MSIEIIDFHTHPFIEDQDNICAHRALCRMNAEETRRTFADMGVSKICGSVISYHKGENDTMWDKLRRNNDAALALRDLYGDFYVPGFHIHPDYIEESIHEIRKMAALGVRLIGELVPSYHGWKNYASDALSVLLDEAEKHDMVIDLHSQGNDEMDEMVKRHPNLVIVGAHPGEYAQMQRHIARAKMSDNYYIDISGTAIFRHGALKRLVDAVGADRLLYGSDFPTCNPEMFLSGVLEDRYLTDDQKEKILSGNAKRLLKI